jgi:outer membrane scaffolding protein for murein synthesis (MipA/OmpV family)
MKRCISALILLSAVSLSFAQGGLLLIDPPPERKASISYGATLIGFPREPGSASLSYLPIPAFEWMDPSGAFLSTDMGLGWNFSARKDLQIGVRLYLDPPRNDTQSGKVSGLSPIPWRLERTAFANWWPVEFAQLQSSVRTGLGPNEDGTLAEFGSSFGAPLSPSVLLGGTIGMTWANGAWRQSFFGVNTTAAASSGLSTFQAGGGWQDFQTSVGLEWKMSPQYRLDARLDQWRLLGAAAASPITQSRWQRGFVLSIWHDLN